MSKKHEALQFAYRAARLADFGDYSWAQWSAPKFDLNWGRPVLQLPGIELREHENVLGGGDSIYVLLAEDKDGITHVWSAGLARNL